MFELKSMPYEECRAEHFKQLMKKMERKIDYWQHRGRYLLKPMGELSRANAECSEAGMQYNFYKDALEALENQPKWISVEEPPKYTCDYLVYVWVAHPDGIAHMQMRTGIYNIVRKEWMIPHDRFEVIGEPEFWTPLPEPPKEE